MMYFRAMRKKRTTSTLVHKNASSLFRVGDVTDAA